MRTHSIPLLVIAVSLLGCIDQAPPDESLELSSTEQGLDNCPTGGALNDELYVGSSAGDSDSYTRPGSKTCATLQTKVRVHMSAAPVYPAPPPQYCIAANSITARVEEGDWGILNDGVANDETECENSSLSMTVTDQNGNSVGVFPSSGVVHPTWKGDHCGGVEIWAANATGLSQGSGTYTVKVKAIRGLEQYNHGYARHTIVAEHDDSYTCQ